MTNITSREHRDRLLPAFDESIFPMARIAEPHAVDGEIRGTEKPVASVLSAPPSIPVHGSRAAMKPRVSRDLLQSLQSILYGVSKRTAASLSELLQSSVHVQFTRLESTTFDCFVESLDSPSCCHILNPFPLEGHWILDLQPAILYPLIDRMLGVKNPGPVDTKRPLTSIELRLASRLASQCIQDFQSIWCRAVSLDLQIAQVEVHPHELQWMTAYEPVLCVGFEVAIGSQLGVVQWCIPSVSIARFEQPLGTAALEVDISDAHWDGTFERLAASQNRNQEAEVIVTLARSTIDANDLADLEVGDIISLETDVHELLEVQVDQDLLFRASPGAYQGRKAIQIERIETARDGVDRDRRDIEAERNS